MPLILLLACLQELSGSCETQLDCIDGELCAKGLCMGRSCESNDDCGPGWECADLLGSQTCLLACAEDRHCLGESTCEHAPVSSVAQAETARYCL